jgi:hypothetical protein
MTNGDELVNPNQDELGMTNGADLTAPDDEKQRPQFNQIQVSDVVKREREKAYEKGRKDALMQMQQESAPQPLQQQQQPQAQGNGLGGMPQAPQQAQMTPEQVQQMIAEQAPQALNAQIQQYKADQLVNTFVQKMQAAEQKYPGLEAELNQLNYSDPRMHAFIELANAQENTGDIMKEVIDNPHKLDQLLNLSINQPYAARKALGSLSNSIKQNEDAKLNEIQARDPMSQLKPSSSAGIETGTATMSVNDFRKMLKQKK